VLFALTAQTRLAEVSVPTNIAEGSGKNYKKDTIRFLHIARGSLYEVETLVNIAVMVEILQREKFDKLNSMTEECLTILNGLISYYEKSNLK